MGHSDEHARRPDQWAQEACEAVEDVDELERKKEEEGRMKKALKKLRKIYRQTLESHEAAKSNPGDDTLGMQAWRSVLRTMNLADWCEVQGWDDQEEMDKVIELAELYENMGYLSVGYIAVESEEQKAEVEAKLEKDEMLKQTGESVACSTHAARSQIGDAEGATTLAVKEVRQSTDGSSSESEGGVLMNGWFADKSEDELREKTDREYEALMGWWTKEQAKDKEQAKTKEQEAEMQKVEKKAVMLKAEMDKCEAKRAELQEKYEMLKSELRECERQNAGLQEKYETAATTIGHGTAAPSTFASSGDVTASASAATSGYAAAPASLAITGEATAMNVAHAAEATTTAFNEERVAKMGKKEKKRMTRKREMEAGGCE